MGWIDKGGNVVLKPQWDFVGTFFQGDTLAIAELNGKFGLIDRSGKTVSEPQWETLDDYREATQEPAYYLTARESGNDLVVSWLDSNDNEIWSARGRPWWEMK
jgi:hypothetical protein